MKGNIILLEDNKQIANYYEKMLKAESYKVEVAYNSSSFFRIYDRFKPDLILLDIILKNSDMDGIEVFQELKNRVDFESKVIILSSEATKYEVAKAMQLGAVNFNEKGENFNRIKLLADIKQAIEFKQKEQEIDKLKKQSLDSILIGQHDLMKNVKDQIIKFSQSDMNLLITGETGTGKGLIAELVHKNSPRKAKPFKTVDIKSISENLIESELFGHVKGSYTGADYDKKGYFESADSGTLFVDEISNLSLSNQMQILKVIEEKRIPIVGSGGKYKDVDVRIISASNSDLTEMVNRGKFRKDLYFRFANCVISIPPLRERVSDISVIAERFLIENSREFRTVLNISLNELKGELEHYSWPGNVRELKNFCRFVSEFNKKVDNKILQDEFKKHVNRNKALSNKVINELSYPSHHKLLNSDNYFSAMVSFEKLYLNHHLEKNLQRIVKTAKSIGLDRTTLYKKLKKHGIEIN